MTSTFAGPTGADHDECGAAAILPSLAPCALATISTEAFSNTEYFHAIRVSIFRGKPSFHGNVTGGTRQAVPAGKKDDPARGGATAPGGPRDAVEVKGA